MLTNVLLKRNGDIKISYFANDDKKHEEVLPYDKILKLYDFSGIELEENFTVRSLSKIIEKYKGLVDINPAFEYCLYNIKKLPQIGCRDNIKEIVLTKTTIISRRNYVADMKRDSENEKKIYFQKRIIDEFKDVMDSYVDCYSYLEKATEYISTDEKCSISLTPLRELLDSPVSLGLHNTNVSKSILQDDGETINYEIKEKIVDDNYHFTVFELVDGIFGEISIFGSDEEKDETVDMIKGRIETLDDDNDDE